LKPVIALITYLIVFSLLNCISVRSLELKSIASIAIITEEFIEKASSAT
jgi:hypothetical protein